MPCNFLTKLDGESSYTHFVIDGCSGANSMSAAIRYFSKRTGLSPTQFQDGGFEGPRRVWIVSQMGLSIFEELFELSVGPVKVAKNPSGSPTSEDFIEGIGYIAKLVEAKPARLLPGIQEMFELH